MKKKKSTLESPVPASAAARSSMDGSTSTSTPGTSGTSLAHARDSSPSIDEKQKFGSSPSIDEKQMFGSSPSSPNLTPKVHIPRRSQGIHALREVFSPRIKKSTAKPFSPSNTNLSSPQGKRSSEQHGVPLERDDADEDSFWFEMTRRFNAVADSLESYIPETPPSAFRTLRDAVSSTFMDDDVISGVSSYSESQQPTPQQPNEDEEGEEYSWPNDVTGVFNGISEFMSRNWTSEAGALMPSGWAADGPKSDEESEDTSTQCPNEDDNDKDMRTWAQDEFQAFTQFVANSVMLNDSGSESDPPEIADSSLPSERESSVGGMSQWLISTWRGGEDSQPTILEKKRDSENFGGRSTGLYGTLRTTDSSLAEGSQSAQSQASSA